MPRKKTEKQIAYALVSRDSQVAHSLDVFHIYRTKKSAIRAARWNQTEECPLEVITVSFTIKTYEV